MNKQTLQIEIVIVLILMLSLVFLLLGRQSNKAYASKQNQVITPKFTKIDADVSNVNIKVQEGSNYEVIFKRCKKIDAKVEKNTLYLKKAETSIHISMNIFDLFKRKAKPIIIIVLPKKELADMSVTNSNGSIKIRDIVVNQGEIDSSNGDIVIEHGNAQGYDLLTSNGHVIVNGKDNGNYYENNSDANRLLSITNSNGNIVIN